MIELTRLNGSRYYLNAEHIQAVEGTPDTHILLTNGQQYVAVESVEEVAERVISYQRLVRRGWQPRLSNGGDVTELSSHGHTHTRTDAHGPDAGVPAWRPGG